VELKATLRELVKKPSGISPFPGTTGAEYLTLRQSGLTHNRVQHRATFSLNLRPFSVLLVLLLLPLGFQLPLYSEH
jgi:hypothetical protein